jgi:Ca2+-binding EF-hand superfamily protein
LHKIFLRFDLDGDGSLTKLELGVLLRSLKLLRLLSLRLAAEDEIHALLAIMELGAFLHSLLLRPAARDEINAFMSAWSSARSSAYSAPVWQRYMLKYKVIARLSSSI